MACEINSGDELVTTEMIFAGVLAELTPEEAVAVLSALVFQVSCLAVYTAGAGRPLSRVPVHSATFRVSLASRCCSPSSQTVCCDEGQVCLDKDAYF